MSLQNIRKQRARSFNDEDPEDTDLHLSKKVKDSEMSDTSSEGVAEDDRLARMAEAMKTIIEVFTLWLSMFDCL